MRPRYRGTIVQVGSALGHRGIPLQTAYCGAKHALEGFHEALRTELMHEHSGIKVTIVEMPAVNTPQFSWVLSRLPHQAQPVPPIYQPEVAARGVLKAIDHPGRRARWVGLSTAGTIMANRVAGGLLDRYLARTGFKSQQTDQPRPDDQPANLWEPADGSGGHDFGAHGAFDDRAHEHGWIG
jgi:short-subunit dehydrogenase